MKRSLATVAVIAGTLLGTGAQAAVYDFVGDFSWGSGGGGSPSSASGSFAGQADWSDGIFSSTGVTLTSLSAFSVGGTAQDLTTVGGHMQDFSSPSPTVFYLGGLASFGGVTGMSGNLDDFQLAFVTTSDVDFNASPLSFTAFLQNGNIANAGLSGIRSLDDLSGSVTFTLPTTISTVPVPASLPILLSGIALLALNGSRSRKSKGTLATPAAKALSRKQPLL